MYRKYRASQRIRSCHLCRPRSRRWQYLHRLTAGRTPPFLIVFHSHIDPQKSTLEHVFLASRILFLCSAAVSSAAPFIEWLVEHKLPNVPGSGTAIDIIGTKLDDLIELMKEGNTATKDAITDLLKLIFNLFVHYPKVSARCMACVSTDSFCSSLIANFRALRLRL